VQGGNEEIRLFWGISADGSVVISDKLEVIKASCAKSFAPFPTGTYNSSQNFQGMTKSVVIVTYFRSFKAEANKKKKFVKFLIKME
jgi:hypothetical protein